MTEFAKFPVDFKNFSSPPLGQITGADRYAVFKEEFRSDVHRRSIGSSVSADSGKEFDGQWNIGDRTGGDSLPSEHSQSQPPYDIFTELDPLGTGKVKPFVDKKDFFNDVRKQTTRRLLRGTGDGEESLPHGAHKVPPGVIPPEVSALVASSSLYNTPNPTTINAIKQPATSTHTTPVHGSVLPSFCEGFTDSFVGLPGSRETQQEGPSSGGFADFNRFSDSPRSQRSEFSSGSVIDEQGTSLSVGSLTVALPPESFRDSPPSFSPPPPPHTPARSHSGSSSPQTALSQHSPVPHHRLTKQITLAAPASPKTLPRSHKFSRQSSYETGWDSGTYFTPRGASDDSEFSPITSARTEGGISPRPRPRSSLSRQFTSGSSTLPLRGSFGKSSFRSTSPTDFECGPFPSDDTNLSYEEAPEPPPRPAHVEPPPLPPKRLPSHITLRPPPRPPPSSEPHYNYINDYDSSPDNAKSPPIPIPARKPRYAEPPCPSSRSVKPQSQTDSFHFPRTSHSPTRDSSSTGAVPKNSSRGSTPSKSSTPGKSPRSGQRGLTPESMDLTNTSLDQLATKLNMPIEQLAKMTVVELAACLAQLQLRSDSAADEHSRPLSGDGYEVPIPRSHSQTLDSREKSSWSSQKFETFEDDDMFARFDAQFPKSPVDAPSFPTSTVNEAKFPLGAPVSEDRYAVFRELSTSAKQKSVFDENLLTPQNSVDDEASEVSSGTFKATFSDGPQPIHQDSVEQKSSISDEIEAHTDVGRNKDWERGDRVDHECVTVFRSPDISEYENFEPNFECKFEDDFSNATLSERSETPVNSPAAVVSTTSGILEPSPRSNLPHKSPFTDDFSKMSNTTVFSEAKYGPNNNRGSNDEKFVSNFNDYSATTVANGRSSAFSEASTTRSLSERSPFEDDFSDFHIEKQRTIDNSSLDDNVFDGEERRSKRFDRSSKRRSKKSSASLNTPPNGSVSDKPPRSPFDDDFSRRTSKYEVLRDMDAERSSPFDDHEDRKSIGSLHSIQEEGRAPIEISNRRSPYSEVMTPPSYILRNRGPSRVSLGSEGSGDIRHSPFDDNFNPGYENGLKNNGNNSSSNNTHTATFHAEDSQSKDLEGEGNVEEKESAVPNFADFESAFKSEDQAVSKGKEDGSREDDPNNGKQEEEVQKPSEETEIRDQDVIDIGSDDAAVVDLPDEEEVFPESETEFKISARFPKSETATIFRRDSDPFSDDFFDADSLSEAPDKVEVPSGVVSSTTPSTSISNKDSFWQESFDNFKFKDG